MSKAEEFIRIVEHIQGTLISVPQYEIKKPEKRLKQVKIFLQENIIKDIWMYLAFTFMYKESNYTRFNVVPFNHLVGKTAYKRWIERSKEEEFVTLRFLMSKGLSNPLRTDKVELSERYLKEQREMYLNTPKGYLKCLSFEGRLFDKEECKKCRYCYVCKTK